ncbi:MAG: hypothetical protein IPK50_14320 [Fibrobacterota bacterium]|nr:hypothetical protein [Fibrobacterota bacterium]QQS03472.1 MAG: hypothetical protein IPK50_14320 [Fibrobacterota bacterium]
MGLIFGSPRLGPWEIAPGDTVWMHAASVGEAKGIVALLRFLPTGFPLTLTATTRSGVERLSRTGHPTFLLPLDEPLSVDRFLDLRRVRVALFFEAEAWPGILQMLRERSIPTAFAAFRSSRASLRKWRRFSRLFPGWTGGVAAVWTDSVTLVGAVERLGFAKVLPGTTLKWAGHPVLARQPRETPLAAAVSFHLRDLPTVLDLAQTHPREGWLWFPRRPGRIRLHRLLARIAGLRVVEGIPDPGEVRISQTFGETPRWLPLARFCWVSPGHDLEEPYRYGLREVWTGRPPRQALRMAAPSDGVAREIAHWLLAQFPPSTAYYNGLGNGPQ